MSKSKWHGEKTGGTHTTCIEAAKPLLQKAESLPEVKRISLGFIAPTPGSRGRIGMKIKLMRGGLKVTIRGNSAVQEIRIYTDSPAEVQQLLEAA